MTFAVYRSFPAHAMQPTPCFDELQAVRLLPVEKHVDWPVGIVVDHRWEEAGVHAATGAPHPARWIYEVQVGNADDLFDIWMAEDCLQAT